MAVGPFIFHAFHPKAVNQHLHLAGLLAYSLLKPSHPFITNSGRRFNSREP